MKQSTNNDFISQGEIVKPYNTQSETTVQQVLKIPARLGKYGLFIRIRTCKIQSTLVAIGQNVKIDCKCLSVKKGVRYNQITISNSDVAPQQEAIFLEKTLIASLLGSLDEFQFIINKESLLKASKKRPYKGIWIVLLAIKEEDTIRVLA